VKTCGPSSGIAGRQAGAMQQFYLNVIHPEGHAFQKEFDKIRIATEMTGPGGAGGQGHVSLRY